MAKKYIDAEALLASIESARHYFNTSYPKRSLTGRDILQIIHDYHAADVAEVVHGHYVTDDFGDCSCSVCGENYLNHTKNFCPNCGARMDSDHLREVAEMMDGGAQ